MATVLYNDKRLPTLKNGKIGYWVLLNGEDTMGGFESLTNEEYEMARDAHLSSLTDEYIQSLTAPIIEEKKKLIRSKIIELKSDEEQTLIEQALNANGLEISIAVQVRCMDLLEERGLWTEEKWFSNDISDIPQEEREQIRTQVIKEHEVKAKQIKEIKAKRIEQLESLMEEDDIWSALQLLGIEKQQSFSLEKPLNEDNPNWNSLKAILNENTFQLGKNEVYARLVLIRNGFL